MMDTSSVSPTAKGKFLKYERSAIPFKIESPFIALGTGREYAMAAMHLGKTAAEAIEVAAHFDSGTGNGVDVLGFEA